MHRLAAAVGLHVDWVDAAGKAQRVSEASLEGVLEALGYPAASERQIESSLAQCAKDRTECCFASADVGQPLVVPGRSDGAGAVELMLEDGTCTSIETETGPGGLRIAGIDVPGYHRLVLPDREVRIAVAPSRCFGVGDAAPGRRLWWAAVQVPALRDGQERAFGDFGALRAAAEAFAGAGADALAISPTHALFPADPQRFSPYGPSSRLFLNVLLGDPALIGQAVAPVAAGPLIDWEKAIPARLAALRQAFAQCRHGLGDKLAAFRESGGAELERHARFDALHAHFFVEGARGWQDWPRELHDADGAAVDQFAAAHPDEIAFFVFAQWLARESLDAAQAAAKSSGMALGLIADLAVGMDPGGSHAWSRRDELLTGLSVGAPPDPLGPDGQDWGLTSFSPAALRRTGFEGFIATLRASLAHAGGIRIDHALGLRRLWVIPGGAPSAEGAYLDYPLADLLRVLAIESHRARAVVIGEDLGTVPEGLRPRLQAREILGMRVLWFEREEDGAFTPPAEWEAQAVAMTGTHDLPTVAGWWQGRDLDWAWQLGRTSPGKPTGRSCGVLCAAPAPRRGRCRRPSSPRRSSMLHCSMSVTPPAGWC
jgi:4-alpha-glucanotransferase